MNKYYVFVLFCFLLFVFVCLLALVAKCAENKGSIMQKIAYLVN